MTHRHTNIKITPKFLSKTRAVTHGPSRLTHWWTRSTTHSITRTWHVIWHFFLQEFLVWDCVSLPNVSVTLLLSNSTIPNCGLDSLGSGYSATGPMAFMRATRSLQKPVFKLELLNWLKRIKTKRVNVISLYMVWSLLFKTPCCGWNSAKLSWNIDRVSLQQGRSWV